jgi:hypothetical protein
MRVLGVGVLLVLAAGCGEAPKPAGPKASDSQGELLRPLVLAAKPDAVLSILEVHGRSDGATVVLTGKVPPPKTKPFNAAVAAFLLMDPAELDKPDVLAEFDCDDAAT